MCVLIPKLTVFHINWCFGVAQTVRFKSYLLSLGIADPVTRESHGTGDKYFRELAKQISSFMEAPLKVVDQCCEFQSAVI